MHYKDKPHGLTIGGDGFFHIITRTTVQGKEKVAIHDFPCILMFKDYEYGSKVNFSTAHVGILTPATQLCWQLTVTLKELTKAGEAGNDASIATAWSLKPWFNRWLADRHIKYSIAPPNSDGIQDRTLYLHKRADALNICNMVETMLGGIPKNIGAPAKRQRAHAQA
jgi:hypothetical protein